jgi:hypothetical protein
MGVYFNGRYYIKPQAATYVDDTALTPVGLVGSNVIGMMGPAKDGVPNQAYLITALKDATEIFSEGPLVDGIAMAFNGGAQYIWATRVGGAYTAGNIPAFASEPSQAIFAAADGDTLPFQLRSVSYGLHANGIIVTTDDNASKGIDVSVVAQGNTIQVTGLYYDILRVQNNSAASITFTISENGSAYELEITDGTNTSAAPIDLVGVASTTDLVDRIKENMALATPGEIDSALFAFTVLKEVPSVQLDTGATVITNGNTGALPANVKAVYDWLNSGTQPYVTAEDPDSIFTTSSAKDASLFVGSTYNFADASTSASTGTVDSTSYVGALAEIYEDLDLDLIVPIVENYLGNTITDSAAAIFTAVHDHCKAMSTTKSEERVGLIGYQFIGSEPSTTTEVADGDADTLTDTLVANAISFNSPYIVVCAPRFKTFDIRGNLKLFNGTYTAAYIAGLIASLPVGEPITNKDVTGIQGLSTNFKNRQILELIDNGVCVVERVGAALKVVQGVTSWISDDNYNKKEISVRLATNYIAKNCRLNLQQFIGRKNSPQILQIIKGSLIQVLRELENNEIIVGTTTYPAYRNLTLTATGDQVYVTFECSPVLPINYILIKIHATVFTATI